jgi:hypothetical protein
MSKQIVVLRQGSRRIRVESDTALAQVDEKAVVPQEGIPEGMQPTSAIDDIREGIDEVKRLIVDTADTLYEAIDSLAGRPAKVTAEFGVKFGGEAGFPVITKVSAEAELKITVEWTRGTA